MENTSHDERKRQQDILRRIDQRLNVLEEHTVALISNIDFESMTPNQRVQASCRLLKLMIRLLELHEDCALSDEDYRAQVFRNLILSLENEMGEQMLHDIIGNI